MLSSISSGVLSDLLTVLGAVVTWDGLQADLVHVVDEDRLAALLKTHSLLLVNERDEREKN